MLGAKPTKTADGIIANEPDGGHEYLLDETELQEIQRLQARLADARGDERAGIEAEIAAARERFARERATTQHWLT